MLTTCNIFQGCQVFRPGKIYGEPQFITMLCLKGQLWVGEPPFELLLGHGLTLTKYKACKETYDESESSRMTNPSHLQHQTQIKTFMIKGQRRNSSHKRNNFHTGRSYFGERNESTLEKIARDINKPLPFSNGDKPYTQTRFIF